MAALEDNSQGGTRGGRSAYERYQEAADDLPPNVEVGADGRPIDVEREEVEQESGRITSPFDPEHIDIETRTTTVDLLLSRLRNEMIDLAPDFQRRAGIWTDEQQSRLIESLLLRIPFPASFFVAEGEDGSWAVVDGIQRLTAIARFVDADLVHRAPLALTGLEYLHDLNGAAFNDLSGRLQIRLREAEVVVHIIRRGTPELVKFNVFARINNVGERLTSQEIRHALIPGHARMILAELAESEVFRKATGYSVVGDRMADREMVLRFLAFRLTPPEDYRKGDFDGFLTDAMHRLNRLDLDQEQRLRDEFAQAMAAAHDIFGAHAFRKYRRGQQRKSPVNKALFEAVAVNVAALAPEERDALRKRNVAEAFARLMEDTSFERAVSSGTGDPRNVRKRFEAVRQLFHDELAAPEETSGQ